MMEKQFLILGYGISGKAAEAFLQKRNKKVLIYDDKKGLFPKIKWENIEKIVVSPGIERFHTILQEALQKKIPLTTEIELGLLENRETIIAITGSNGKTTTTLFLEYLFKKAGLYAKALGNVGDPFCTYVPKKGEILLLEISSFQLEPLEGAFFDYALFLNLYPNHLDWHKTMENYANAKKKIASCLKPSGILWTDKKWEYLFPKGSFFPEKLPFPHIREDISEETVKGAWEISQHWNIEKNLFLESLTTFQKPKHRLQYVGEKKGVLFYNDSKATNEEAVLFAIQKISSPLRLIVGGLDKGSSFLSWKENLVPSIKKVYAYGFAAEKIKTVLQSRLEVAPFSSFKEAVKAACLEAKKREVVLLSPGCSSFDQFQSFEERGDVFMKIVEQWMQEGSLS